jgi:hypothetical protein
MSPSTKQEWGQVSDVVDAARKLWDRGTLLRELHAGADAHLDTQPDGEVGGQGSDQPVVRQVFPLRVNLRAPSGKAMAADYANAQVWARSMVQAAAQGDFRLESIRRSAGALGVQEIPYAAWIDTPEQALKLLPGSAQSKSRLFASALNITREYPQEIAQLFRQVALARPFLVLEAGEHWPSLLKLSVWLRSHPRPGLHLRQVSVPGLHTKIIETHKPLLRHLFDAVVPAEAVLTHVNNFEERYGFAISEREVRIRSHGQILGLGQMDQISVIWPLSALASWDAQAAGVRELLVVENKLNALTAPLAPGRLILFGAGYGVHELLAAVPWCQHIPVRYWGDVDSHGFALLSAARAVVPHLTSVLMDSETLMAHQALWVPEDKPSTAQPAHLTTDEAQCLQMLSQGPGHVRLEQELIRFDLVQQALAPHQ